MVSVTVRGLSKTYDRRVPAIRNVTLEVRDGEFFVLLGPSGSGKTTLLNCIAGILTPDEGEILFGDRVVFSSRDRVNVPPQERDVGMVFQDYALYPHMTVFDNIAFPLKNRRLPRAEMERRVREVADFLGIGGLLDRKPGQLSGGQRQRVALARALVKRPAVLLMDEPLANLDAKLRALMRSELKRLQREVGTTVIYVTHDQVEAMAMADRVAVISEGAVQQVGEPLELYHRPANTFVAGFIGTPPMNLLEGDVASGAVDLGFCRVPLPPGASVEGGRVTVGIRPEHVRLASPGEPGAFKAAVTAVEALGREVQLHLSASGRRLVAVAPMEPSLLEAREVWARLDPAKVRIFDREGRLVA